MQEATLKNLKSGSTATVVLIADGQILAANVGDSKAFLCSEDFSSHHKKGFFYFLKSSYSFIRQKYPANQLLVTPIGDDSTIENMCFHVHKRISFLV